MQEIAPFFSLIRNMGLLSLALSSGCSPLFLWKTSPLFPEVENIDNEYHTPFQHNKGITQLTPANL